MAFAYRQSEEQRLGRPQRHAVVVIGAGPVGLTLALELARHGQAVLVLDDNDELSSGSRAVCWAQKSLEVFARHELPGGASVADALLARGVRWQRGRVFHGEREAYAFDLQPQPGHRLPAMLNLQQCEVEQRLVEACALRPEVELRWKHELIGLTQTDQGVQLDVRTPDGLFEMRADWVVACDGARSPTRTLLGIPFVGQAFEDRFLIADVRLAPDARPRGLDPARPERWFWFDPPFHRGQSVLLHAQADGVWRIDFQLGRQADAQAEREPGRVRSRVAAMLGEGVEFELAWVSVYQFACRRAQRWREGRVLLAGDAAHQVSPFGARGANSGVQDAENLAWKLAAVCRGAAGAALLDSYESERQRAADDNIAHSTRATDFISPHSALSRRLQRAVLDLAEHQPWARPLVNSGRLSTPSDLAGSPLLTPDEEPWPGGPEPGQTLPDAPLPAPLPGAWFSALQGQPLLLAFGESAAAPRGCATLCLPAQGLAAERLAAGEGAHYLLRPDAVVAARWRRPPTPAALHAAWQRLWGGAHG